MWQDFFNKKGCTWGRHVGCTRGLDLLDALEAVLLQDFVEVCDDLVEETQTLNPLVVGLQLHVELGKVGDGGEDYAPAVALLVVQLLIKNLNTCIELNIWINLDIYFNNNNNVNW